MRAIAAQSFKLVIICLLNSAHTYIYVDHFVLQELAVLLLKSYEEAMKTAHKFLSVFLSK